ncbi:hypothetical protein LSAT2_003045 [Lamellibrachia satsuma]|nr:hypothetical protein LSAT2_003045 [Lamellibrachia satsuma]
MSYISKGNSLCFTFKKFLLGRLPKNFVKLNEINFGVTMRGSNMLLIICLALSIVITYATGAEDDLNEYGNGEADAASVYLDRVKRGNGCPVKCKKGRCSCNGADCKCYCSKGNPICKKVPSTKRGDEDCDVKCSKGKCECKGPYCQCWCWKGKPRCKGEVYGSVHRCKTKCKKKNCSKKADCAYCRCNSWKKGKCSKC